MLAGPVVLAIAAGAAGCGEASRSSPAQAGSQPARTKSTTATAEPRLRSVSVATVGSLPAGVADPAVAALRDGRVVLLGGLDESGGSTAAITVLTGAAASRHDALPQPQHDAEAVALGADVYVFGGGGVSSYAHILRYDPATGSVSDVGELPVPASDVSVAAIGQTAYVIGGYDGSRWLDTIVAFKPGSAPRVVAHLPVGLRYAGVAAVDGRLIIVGGTTPNGLSSAILSFDPATAAVTRLGRLPVGLAHTSAVSIAGEVLIVGGRRQTSGGRTATILAIDPGSGAVRRVGELPQPLSDAAVTASGSRVIVLGGETTAGPQSSILAVTPRPAGSGAGSP
jgi:N-acetylneuraminic acid mutarotase